MNRRSPKDEHYYAQHPRAKPKLGLIRTRLRGHFFEFLTASSVFSRKQIDLGTRLLIESMILPEKGAVLDLGCGYGPVGITAATLNPALHVVLVDVNKRAIWLAKENAKRNQVENVEIRQGFVYEPIAARQFDTILCNPPVAAGMHLVSTMITSAPTYLKKGGSLQVVVRSRIGGARIQRELETAFGNSEILARKSGYRVLVAKKS